MIRTFVSSPANMQRASIKALPTEVLYNIFQQISGDEQRECKRTVKNTRLVSHRFKTVASTFLIKSVTTRMTSQSLSHLEGLCQHPDFSKSITQVTIDTRYYDAKLAKNRRQYAVHCGYTLSQFAEYEERAMAGALYHGYRGQSDANEEMDNDLNLFDVSEEFHQVGAPSFKISSATQSQKSLIRMHEEYVKLSEDQEEVRFENNHIRRLCVCLSNLPALKQLVISDREHRIGGDKVRSLDGSKAPDSDKLLEICMARSGWNGSFETAYTTEPPVEMLGELMSQLGRAAIRPQVIEIDHNAPADFKCLRVSEEQSKGIHNLVSQTSNLAINFCSLDRKGSLAENNNRSRDEMLAIGSLFKALTNTTSLESLKVGFERYPVFYQFPTADMSDLLPIRSMTWPKLQHVVFNHMPYDLNDLAVFVSSHRGSIKSFKGTSMYLRNGDWNQALDILRRFKDLKDVELTYPQGGRYIDGMSSTVQFPQEEAEKYVRKMSLQNPL